MGWGVLDCEGWERRFVEHGAIRTTALGDLSSRLVHLAASLRAVIARLRPDACAVEQVFTAKNSRSALVLGHARGVALLVAAEADIPLHEYTAMQVKCAVTGYGSAEKGQVQRVIATQLGLKCLPTPLDASDALAVALCHAGAARAAKILAASRAARR